MFVRAYLRNFVFPRGILPNGGKQIALAIVAACGLVGSISKADAQTAWTNNTGCRTTGIMLEIGRAEFQTSPP